MDAIETEGDELMDSSQLNDDEEEVKLPGLPPNTKNYMTPACYRRLLDEREKLVNVERPAMVNVVSWAASNGDRSENGDYLYGKRRLREMDRRIRFLNKRIESAEVVDPATPSNRPDFLRRHGRLRIAFGPYRTHHPHCRNR